MGKTKAQASTKKNTSSFEINDAPVVVFDETKYGIKKSNTPRPTSRADPSPMETNSNDPDDIADMEVNKIWEKLKDSVEDIHASNLRGKDRKKYIQEKVIRLGGREQKKQNIPRNIRVGMVVKGKEREKRKIEQAREQDLVIAKSGGRKPDNGKNRNSSKRSRK